MMDCYPLRKIELMYIKNRIHFIHNDFWASIGLLYNLALLNLNQLLQF
jgi:hypothetical protein